MGKRSIQSVDALVADVRKLFDVVNSESDLSMALVATSYIDAALGALLSAKLTSSTASRKLLDTHGPLGAYGARCHAARALDLIDGNVYASLQLIGQIRNEFAHHHLAFDFGEPSIIRLCEQLMVKHPIALAAGDATIATATRARAVFSMTAVFLIGRLLSAGRAIEAEKATLANDSTVA